MNISRPKLSTHSGLMLVIALQAVFFTNAAGAADIKPGLWEMQMNFGNSAPGAQAKSMAQAQASMDKMSKEERKMMQDMMAGMGMSMSKPNAIQLCITPEQAKARDYGSQNEPGCTHKVTSQNDKGFTVAFKCQDSEGTASTRFLSDKAYETEMDITVTVEGKKQKIKQSTQSKWISADCGKLAPVSSQKK